LSDSLDGNRILIVGRRSGIHRDVAHRARLIRRQPRNVVGAQLVARGLTPATLKHHWSTMRNVFTYAVRHKAISASPVDAVDFSADSAERRNRRHHPLTAEQVAAVAASVGERYPVYELLTLFAAYTGLRSEELAGLEIADIAFAPVPARAPLVCSIHVCLPAPRRPRWCRA
jgi:integrase